MSAVATLFATGTFHTRRPAAVPSRPDRAAVAPVDPRRRSAFPSSPSAISAPICKSPPSGPDCGCRIDVEAEFVVDERPGGAGGVQLVLGGDSG